MLLMLALLVGLSARNVAGWVDDSLFYAARDGIVPEVRRILGEGSISPDTPHESGLTALMWAATSGQVGAITALLDGG